MKNNWNQILGAWHEKPSYAGWELRRHLPACSDVEPCHKNAGSCTMIKRIWWVSYIMSVFMKPRARLIEITWQQTFSRESACIWISRLFFVYLLETRWLCHFTSYMIKNYKFPDKTKKGAKGLSLQLEIKQLTFGW